MKKKQILLSDVNNIADLKSIIYDKYQSYIGLFEKFESNADSYEEKEYNKIYYKFSEVERDFKIIFRLIQLKPNDLKNIKDTFIDYSKKWKDIIVV